MTDRAALVEKVAKAIADAVGECGPDWRNSWKWHVQSATAAIALIRAEVLEEALNALYSVPRWDREIFDSLTQTSDGSLIYIEEADAAIRALKGGT